MIHIDLDIGIALYLFLTVSLVLMMWMSYNYSKDKPLTNQQKDLEQCPFCTFVFFDYKKLNVKICPNCKSYITGDKF